MTFAIKPLLRLPVSFLAASLGRFDGVGQHDLRDFHSRDLVVGLVDPRFLNILDISENYQSFAAASL
ncbi:hypothetical protein [Nostoc sp. FACHB-888]|uniref:hypothetical protein n=1 Tax=Nostoc sp. FACHB-888 TaxID=2692842 RepID=UPI0016851023|nr:hypothetical protein [Nostoc sp. FACHB-888]MBD2248722.1 hypothetical protein [Nostoc sp. FACHB-888]